MKLAALLVLAVLAVPAGARAHGGMFETGRVSILTSSRAPMFDLSTMVPGSHYTRRLAVGNNGSLDASWQLDATTAGDVRFLRRLRVDVDESLRGVRRRVFAGPIAELQGIPLGVFDPGDSRTYVFSVQLISGGAEDRTGAAKVDFRWTATGVYG